MRWPVVLAAVVALAGCADDQPSAGDQRADQAQRAAEDAGLPEDVGGVLALATRAVDATYTVTYDLDGRTFTVTQRPPDRRIDLLDSDGVRDSTITVDGRTTICTDPGDDAELVCTETGQAPPDGVFGDEDLAAFTSALEEQAAEADISVETRDLVGTEATCLVVSGGGLDSVLCLAGTGAVLLVDRPAGTLRATAYSTDVDDDAFTVPTVPAGTD